MQGTLVKAIEVSHLCRTFNSNIATSSVLPLTRSISAARLLIQGASLTEVIPLLLGELVVGLAYALLGYLLFAVLEVEAKKRGTLEVF
jgi:hypothetical protein